MSDYYLCEHKQPCCGSCIRGTKTEINRLEAKISSLKEENKRYREALQMLYDETAEYIKINHLGDVHNNQSMKLAKEALKEAKND